MRNRNGFTLIELLVVITIMTILAGLLLPGVMRAMKQAKSNRTLSEMQHLATVITQVYSEVGYYVRLEDLLKIDSGGVLIWARTTSSLDGQSDDDLGTDSLILQPTSSMWNGPYITYKSYSTTTNRPLDPWGAMGASNANNRQYRMFWINRNGSTDIRVPIGANGAMVIISAGGDGIYNCNISGPTNPSNAALDNFEHFDPSIDKGDDIYYIFNAGIQ